MRHESALTQSSTAKFVCGMLCVMCYVLLLCEVGVLLCVVRLCVACCVLFVVVVRVCCLLSVVGLL